ncbi:MAG TPA: cupin domain-containing protein [Baekduia sp.]|nr:cupin domain-containing protein [Baekduia sp.]
MSPIVTGHVARTELQPADYSAVTTAGDARARMTKLSTAGADGRLSTVGVFACEPCTIVAELKTDETIHVLEGEVRIALDDGSAVELGPGDVAVLPRGAVATWTVKTPFRELFFLSGVPA